MKVKKDEKGRGSSRETTKKTKTTNNFAEPKPETASSSVNHTYPLRSQSKRSSTTEPSAALKSSLTRLSLTQAKRFEFGFLENVKCFTIMCYSRSPLRKRELAALGVASSSSSGSRPTASPAVEEPGPSGLCRSGAVLRRSTRSGKGKC